MRRDTVMKFVGFAVGLAAKFTTGSIFVFNVYQDAIKHDFNYTQTEVELLSSMLNVGLGVGFVPGMFYDRFGPTITSAAGLVVSVSIYLLIWSTNKNIQFYSQRAWLMSIYFLLAGFGSVFTYMVSLNTNVINFSAKHTGKVVGFLNAFFAGSPSVFATIYYHYFTTGDSTDPANHNFSGFMLFFAILFGIVNILCMIFLRIYTNPVMHEDVSVKYYKDPKGNIFDEYTAAIHGQQQPLENGNSDNTFTKPNVTDIENGDAEKDNAFTKPNVTEETPSATYGQVKEVEENDPQTGIDVTQPEVEVPLTLWQTLCNLNFHIFICMFALASSVGLVYGNNITVTSKSLHLDYYNNKLVIIIPITNAIVSASVGVLSDLFKERIPRVAIVVLACGCFIISQALVMALGDILTMLIVATVFAGIGIGIIWSLCPTIMKEMFSAAHLGRNWGIALLLAAVLAFVAQIVFGRLYDMQIQDEDENDCYGKVCIVGGYGVFLGVAISSLLMGLVILLRRRCCKGNGQ